MKDCPYKAQGLSDTEARKVTAGLRCSRAAGSFGKAATNASNAGANSVTAAVAVASSAGQFRVNAVGKKANTSTRLPAAAANAGAKVAAAAAVVAATATAVPAAKPGQPAQALQSAVVPPASTIAGGPTHQVTPRRTPRRSSNSSAGRGKEDFLFDSDLDDYFELNLNMPFGNLESVPAAPEQRPPSPPIVLDSQSSQQPTTVPAKADDPPDGVYTNLAGVNLNIAAGSIARLTTFYSPKNSDACKLNDELVNLCMDLFMREHQLRSSVRPRHHKVYVLNSFFMGKLLGW